MKNHKAKRTKQMNYSEYFECIKLPDNTERLLLKEGAPQDLYELLIKIHKEDFFGCWGNDWIYSTIYEAFCDIEREGKLLECMIESDIYNHDLCKWLYENCNAYAQEYCNEATGEGLAQEGNLVSIISCGQYLAKSRIYNRVSEFLNVEKE